MTPSARPIGQRVQAGVGVAGYTVSVCGRYTVQNPAGIPERFLVGFSQTRIEPLPEPRFNVAPSQDVPIVVPVADGRALRTMRWGFRPAWMRETGNRPPPINARAETLLERPLFRGAVARHRCLIPADGFFEWQALPGRKTKQPWHFRLQDGALFAFAGLYAESDAGATCALITTEANDLVRPIHDRMPVILRPDDEALWLDPTTTGPTAVLPLLAPYPEELMAAYPVSPAVSSVANDGPHLVAPLA